MDYKDYVGLGIAGNFALHLKQAGEEEDFKDVKVEDENGPKGIFPFYLPESDSFLNVYPLSSDEIVLPSEEVNVQAEPEVGLVCEFTYEDGKLIDIKPTHFGAYNDCSIRKKGVKKISQKKNWGASSKGFATKLIEVDKFDANSFMDYYRISSFLRRDGMVMRYGEDAGLCDYSYMYKKLTDWVINQVNTQEDEGPLENINNYLAENNYPTKVLMSIGATRYMAYGENNYLKEGDEIIVVVYDSLEYCRNPIIMMATSNNFDGPGLSALVQKVKNA